MMTGGVSVCCTGLLAGEVLTEGDKAATGEDDLRVSTRLASHPHSNPPLSNHSLDSLVGADAVCVWIEHWVVAAAPEDGPVQDVEFNPW